MPRPGPRPYECVKRAWHSDRHQPTRGSIIQQIFRVAQESHSPGTKKNKEWQEKLPVVVLKAEEIMYSKANSEAEYMDLGTLWDRVNDAINIIIKRDESTETGYLLPPCVEAALNLGCVRVRTSRSQRNANTRSYLGQKSQEPNNTTNERNPQLPSVHSGNELTFPIPLSMNSTQSNRPVSMNSIQYNIPVGQKNSCNNPSTCCNSPSLRFEVPPLRNNQFIAAESNALVNGGSFCPLYYGTHFQPEMPQLSFQVPRNPNAIIVGRPIFPSTEATTKKFFLQNLFTSERDESTSNIVSQADSRNYHGKASESGFDLSLRLGLFEEPCLKPRRVLAHDTATVGLNSSHDRSLFSNSSPYQIKEFSFFPVEIANDPFESHTIRWNSEGEGQNAEAASRKRKAPLDENL